MTETVEKLRVFKRKASYHVWEQEKPETEIKLRISDYDEAAKVWRDLFFAYMPKKESLPEVDGQIKALDVGCNTGYNTKSLEEMYGYAEGIDPNNMLIGHSRFNNAKCHFGRAERLEYADESFSFVIAKDTLEHCADPLKAIEEAYRVLADGGMYLVMIPLDGEPMDIDDVVIHPSGNYNNNSHFWKATQYGVLRRFFETGFTNVQYSIHNHSAMFGVVREFGDNVIVVLAEKRKDTVKVPTHYLLGSSYWAAFLTLGCNSNCWYCIQHVCKDEFVKARKEYESNKVSGRQWVEYYNKLQKWGNQSLGILGGEPTIHPDFFDIVNGIKGYYKTVTTNLATDAILHFDNRIQDKASLRINTSYHPSLISVEDFAQRIHMLRSQGFTVDQIAMVDTPDVDFRKYHTEFLKRGIALNPQTFLGLAGGEIYPDPDSTIYTDHGETGVTNRARLEEGFSCKKKEEVLCASGRFLVAPDGGIYRCHYQLYSGIDKQGDMLTGEFPLDQDYRMCQDYGFCNPCDYPHVDFRPVLANLGEVLMAITENDADAVKVTADTIQHFMAKGEEYQTVFNEVFNKLYSSQTPYWQLYNNKELHDVVNAFMNAGSFIDNEQVGFLASFEYSLFKALRHGVNIYRIFDDTALVKYLALAAAIHSEVAVQYPGVQNILGEESDLLAQVIAKVVSTWGTDLAYSEFMITDDKEIENE